ncbi:BTB/POZ domain-containing protein [Raphanus sativus]|uniref:BTB/POZ domain-containing protein At3g08570 n=1 Tax=Raphanus sativus TaxID=3726 RepID=A0A6J0LHG7_RAPSA|nr:BTB/POZ domain-containing protein At3g08570 [Raphanus sativus]KAJ4916909.1 BTB/POZ domain-containing protein [Raphanus sativus]
MGTSNNSPSPPTTFSKSFTTRIFSDVAGDITIIVDGEPFLLHKFPLVARCGKIRKLVAAEMKDSSRALSHTDLPDFPGGSDTFELAMKFCYGINFEITVSNVASLRCAAGYLEMTEDHKEDNLVSRTETYLEQVVFRSLEKSVEVLSSCELLHPHAEASHVPERCVEAIAMNACREQLVLGLSRLNRASQRGGDSPASSPEWWIQDLSALRIDYYARVVSAMARTGLRSESIITSLIHYSQESLKGIRNRQERTKLDSGTIENEQRSVVEAIVSLFPNDKVPLSFLFGMLRVGVTINVSDSCRVELEMRIAQQLERVSLDDLLIPVVQDGDSMYDVDTVHRILVCFLKRVEDEERNEDDNETETEIDSTCHSSLLKVGLIVDAYLAEIAPDPFLSLNKFRDLIEILPDYVRVTHDGLYRAIDMFLKGHPLLTEQECKSLCKFVDTKKLTREACNHAAQNDRLPVQMVVRVLYSEQLRLKNIVSGESGEEGMMLSSQKLSSGVPSGATSPRDTYASLRRENRELKLEISRVRVRLSELEKDQVLMKQGMMEKSGHGGTLLTSLSKGIGRMSIFGGGDREEKRRKANRKTRSRLKGKTVSNRTESMF